MKQYEVILNGAALGLTNGDNLKTIDAERVEYDESTGRTSFYVGEELVAQFVNVFGITLLTPSNPE